jgi:glycosyltransferase involved in cell wall biosynthesis
VDYFIANSQHTAKRIWRCYHRQAKVIYPPVNTENCPFSSQKEDFYLIVSRLVSYKQVSLIVQAFNQLQRPLVVIGNGPQREHLQAIARPHIQILGWQSETVVKSYMARAKAFVYAACEDFGIALVEAQACGTPVIAYGAGGALETVRDIRTCINTGTGIFFKHQTIASLVEAVQNFETYEDLFKHEYLRSHAEGFSSQVFANDYLDYLDSCQKQHHL